VNSAQEKAGIFAGLFAAAMDAPATVAIAAQ